MKTIEETMMLSISEVFEKMFFIFLETLDDEDDEYDIGYDMESSIRFDGPLNGEVRVLLSRDMVKSMIHNLLGMDEEEITPQKIEDCSKEAANMICGDFLSKFDSTRVFTLSVPTFRPHPGDLTLKENTCRMDLVSDGKGVGVIVAVN